ncbi:carbon monoxide dehydrogenase [Aquicoccus sp. SCR17]|nr:carbon monoxide dehydrogenase [Carideicomes alvinocaridis]
MYAFEFERPGSLDAAVKALQEEDAQALGGGQTLIPTLKQRLAMPSKLVSLKGIAELQGIAQEGDVLKVGGGSTHGAVARETKGIFAGLSLMASKIGDPAVRNRGTMGGSLANNDPAACYPAALMATRGTVVTNTREIAAEEYFQGLFTTALEEGEIITSIRFPLPEKSNYQKFEQPASRFPLVGVFVAKYGDRVGVGVTGASEDGVFAWKEAEEALAGNFAPEAVDDLWVSAEGMMSDLHGTAEYRAHLVKVMTKRAVAAAE